MFGKILEKLVGGKHMPSVSVGKNAPSFELTDTDGNAHSLQAGLTQGPLLAAFFKVSCPTCQYTFPFIERLYQQFQSKGVQVWGISQDDARESQRFAKQYAVTFPLLLDDDHYEISRQYGLKYVPTLFLISPDGRVELWSEGFTKADLLQIQKLFAKYHSLAPPPLFEARERVPEYKPG